MSGEGPRVPTTTRDVDDLLSLALSRPHEALLTARSLLTVGVPASIAAVAHQVAGIVLRDFGDIHEALAEFRAGLRSARQAGDHERGADLQAAYGVALVLAGRPQAGLAQIDAAARGAVGPAAGRIQIRKAHSLWVLGRNGEMLRAAQRAVSLLSGGDLVWEARAFSHRAMAHLALGSVTRADQDYLRAEELFARGGQLLEYASARHDRGATAFARGDLPAALALLDDAQHLVEELDVFEPELIVTRVQVLLAAELNRDALRVADEAVARSEQVRGSATRRGELLFAGALAAAAAGDPATAVARSGEALRMFRRQQRPWWAARAELVLLESRFDTGEVSAPLLRAAVRLATTLEKLDPTRAPEAHLLAGRVALARHRPRVGSRHLRAAAARRPRAVRARTTGWLARAVLAESENRWPDMLTACARGLDLIDGHQSTLGDPELRAQATAQGAELARLALRRAVRSGNARQMLAWSERWRATALTGAQEPLAVDTGMTRDLAALRVLARRLETVAPQRAGPAALHQERRRLEDSIRRQALRRPGAGTERSPRVRISELRGMLAETELVELSDVDGELFAVVLTGDRPPVLHHVGATAVAERALTYALFALRREGTRRGQSPLDLHLIGLRLQQALLGPVVDALVAPAVVLVPTGRLHAVPWALLPGLQQRVTTIAPSAATWLRGRRSVPPEHRRVVLVGGPRLSTGVTEVRSLAEQYPDAVVLADGEATSEKVLAAIDGAWLVHVAAHGTFRADNPLLSALELDDGPLTVYDLERLRQAPFRVVLSSCNSAVGAPSGADELLGVVSALISLGSAGVVASVVPVDDPGTVPFMLALHRFIPDRPLGQALAQARWSVQDDPVVRCVAESFIALGS